ncbi:MAG TPA: aldo/keto reductase [Chloroflexi bacterium]|nr:aldo/keto reductase [Chloroflexota bacterium]
MEKIQLSNTDLRVSKIALGCWGFAGGSMWGAQDDADSIATIHAALDTGINFFENAQGYGDGYSETVLGRALQGRRHEAIIATKMRPQDTSPQGIEAACEQSLKRLQIGYIDLLQPHWPFRQISAEETFLAFENLRQAGKIRAFGVSNYGVGDLGEILQVTPAASNQLPYSLLFRAIEYDVQPLCVQENVSILCYSTLLHGLLAGKFTSADEIPDGRARTRHFSKNRSGTRHDEEGCETEVFAALEQIRQIAAEIGQPMALVAVAWVLHQPGVASVIAGARQPEQIRELAAAADLVLEPKVIQKLNATTEPVKQILGPNPDMWMSESRFR